MLEENNGSYSPASGAQVLNGSSRGFQHCGILGLLQQRGVDADHLRLVQQLIAYKKGGVNGEDGRRGSVEVRRAGVKWKMCRRSRRGGINGG